MVFHKYESELNWFSFSSCFSTQTVEVVFVQADYYGIIYYHFEFLLQTSYVLLNWFEQDLTNQTNALETQLSEIHKRLR